MQLAVISRILGKILLYFTAILFIPLIMAIFTEKLPHHHFMVRHHISLTFLNTMLICLAVAGLFSFMGRKADGVLGRRESILLVCLLWFVIAAICSLPFILSGAVDHPLDAYFEAMSSLTTTGASVLYPKAYDPITAQEIAITLPNPHNPLISYTFYGTLNLLVSAEGIENLGKSLLFWRCFMQWLGGMGIVVLFVAVLPALAIGGKFLFETEMTGPNKESITPRIKETAGFLWKIYVGLSILEILLLILSNSEMTLFEAVTMTFSTISTGGLSLHNEGIMYYNNTATSCIATFFMILGSLSFSLYFYLLKGKASQIYTPELSSYLLSLLIGSCLMTLLLWKGPVAPGSGTYSLKEALSMAPFQAISAQTSTGFILINYDRWPMPAQSLLLVLMFMGGMAGSTSGGLKIARCLLALKLILYRVKSFFRPHEIYTLKIGNKGISESVGVTVLAFFGLVVLITTFGAFILIIDGIDPLTALGTVSCMLNNSGLAFGGIGSELSVPFLSPLAKVLCIIWMALGRLEFFALVVLFMPSFWRNT